MLCVEPRSVSSDAEVGPAARDNLWLIHLGSCGSHDAGTTGELLVVAIRSDDVGQLRAILAANHELANARLATGRSGLRTPLQVVTDWPGYCPNGPEVVRMLLACRPECHDRRSAVGDPAALGRRAQMTSRSPRR
jgi:hypothetical protein